MVDARPVEAGDLEYEEWLERVRSTYRAVHYTCLHRLTDPRLAGAVAVQVTAGLIARPMVFRYFGLPYSGRIARLAEARLAEAEAGILSRVCEWSELDQRLEYLPPEHREVLVAVCVRGDDLKTLATALGSDEQTAVERRTSTLTYMRHIATPGLAATADLGAEEE